MQSIALINKYILLYNDQLNRKLFSYYILNKVYFRIK